MNLKLRHEIKYRISHIDYLIYMSQLSKLLTTDTHGEDGAYTVSSLYFDDLFHTGYYDKLDGLSRRHKYRIRYYDDDFSKIKIERKSKYDQMTHKYGEWLSEDFKMEDLATMETDQEWLILFLTKYQSGSINPSSFVRYERVAFHHPVGNLRVTFDSNVRGINHNPTLDLGEEDLLPLLEENVVVMEVKFEGIFPEFLKGILASGTKMAESTSKYVYSKVSYMS